MSNILDKILAEKEKEIEMLKSAALRPIGSEKRSFLSHLQNAVELAVIAEFKRASPSRGDINMHRDPVSQALSYAQNGAAAVSVLTDQSFFKGDFKDLTLVKEAVKIPVLCKDFMIDETQIIRAEHAGADIILLIAAALNRKRLQELHQFAQELGFDVLVEVHNQAEAESAINIGAKLIGINNRNLTTFHVDIAKTEELAPIIKNSRAYVISESGLKTSEDIVRVKHAGANGILVGEAFMAADGVSEMFDRIKRSGKEHSSV
ncbi:indole-3-glycerol phosphate synthase TrpC [Bacillus mesophilum]|uniref:Indole-3-glycerol phosphate synthase n=1 Tax=Bacillus mesophilum TaxID=1071718 RepID=A0A7V7UVL6_9BACI|nr:indole-3-glycerol phosphate synthase TrpC [Bacillus mesophilum]KAB2333486.1 indole-3-glycerol phosphate synthase TrpC [Bacillus mesophilum]